MFKFIKIFIKSFTHKKISYSYGGVDSLILDIFKDKKKGFYTYSIEYILMYHLFLHLYEL